MRDAALLLAALTACVIGLAWLALAMDVHWRQAFGEPAPPRGAVLALRMLGALVLLGSLLLCLAVDHATMASLVWVMALAAAALAVAFTLAWRPRLLRLLAPWAR